MEYLKGASLRQVPALPTNIRLSWKGLPRTKTLAYYVNPYIMSVKSFIAQAPGVSIETLFTAVVSSVS